jgi:hypothetical protein
VIVLEITVKSGRKVNKKRDKGLKVIVTIK